MFLHLKKIVHQFRFNMAPPSQKGGKKNTLYIIMESFIWSRCRNPIIKSTCENEFVFEFRNYSLTHCVVAMSDKFLDRSLTKRENLRNPQKIVIDHRRERHVISSRCRHPNIKTCKNECVLKMKFRKEFNPLCRCVVRQIFGQIRNQMWEFTQPTKK